MIKSNETKTGEAGNDTSTVKKPVLSRPFALALDIVVVLLMACLLYWGTATQFSNVYNDATRYQCYAVAFWGGMPALSSLPTKQCAYMQGQDTGTVVSRFQQHHYPGILIRLAESQSTSQPLHTLPQEYPLLTLALFSLPLLAPFLWYQTAFAIFMALVAAGIYFMLKRSRGWSAALPFAAYLVVGNWATAEARFDLVAAILCLGAALLASRKHWNWAYALLAFATLIKFFPVVLLPPLLIAQQMQMSGRWSAWARWKGLALFVGLGVGFTALSFLLNIDGTLSPFHFFLVRPLQVESFPAALVWLGTFAGYPAQYPFVYQSLGITSRLSSKISLLFTGVMAVGVLYTYWLQWKERIDVITSFFLTLLVVIAFGKIFSPQYLIWVVPFVAYVGRSSWKWLLSWGAVSALTTWIFPYTYYDLNYIVAHYYRIALRDIILVGITLAFLMYVSRHPAKAADETLPTSADAIAGLSGEN